MKEFDFDELDRAVNSLMAKSDEGSAGTDQATVPVVKNTSNVPAPEVSESNTNTAASLESREETSSTPPREEVSVPVTNNRPSGIAPRRGTVIDGIHSSTTRPSENLRPSRQGKTIQPDNAPSPSGPLIDGFVRSPSSMATPPSTEESAPAEADDTLSPMIESPLKQLTEQPVEDNSGTDEALSEASNNSTEPGGEEGSSLPNETETSSTTENTSNNEVIDEAESSSAIDTMIVSSAAETPVQPAIDTTGANSPFLPNTKVEKRPLGKATDSPEVKTESSETANEGDTGTPAVATSLPAELHDDLVDIESRVAEEPEKPAATSDFTKRYTPVESSMPSPVAAPTTEATPTTSPETQGAIYAADAHQQPLQHPAKKKSGVMLVVWIVVLLLIGAGGGAALYFSGIL